MSLGSSLVLVLGALAGVSAQYSLRTTYDRNNFFDQFYFRDAAYFKSLIGVNDPTNGFVEYVSATEATRSGLAAYRGNQIYVGSDSTAKVASNGIGRKSVRLESKQTFDTGLLIADIQHMPGKACGVWPAFWSFNFAESPYSEIDILEGNGWTRQSENTVSLHTCGTCNFPNLQGPELRKDCDLHAGANCEGGDNPSGCGVDGATDSYGSGFNTNNGGVYATLLDSAGVKIWFFPRSRIPADITSGRPTPSVSAWGAPQANFQSGNNCNVQQRFKNQTIIINTAFCGDIIYDWNQQTEGSSQCSSGGMKCEAYVGQNPQAFTEAYWLFNSIKLYQQ